MFGPTVAKHWETQRRSWEVREAARVPGTRCSEPFWRSDPEWHLNASTILFGQPNYPKWRVGLVILLVELAYITLNLLGLFW